MEFQVALLDSLNAYQIFFIGTQDDCNTYYYAQLANNFNGVYNLSPNTHSMNFLMLQSYVANMNTDQQSGINSISTGCQQFCVLVSF